MNDNLTGPEVTTPDRSSAFQKELTTILNRYSMENGSDTPDFILAQYLRGCLVTFDQAVKARTKWYMPSK